MTQTFTVHGRLPGLNELIEMRAKSPHVYRRAKERYGSMIGLFIRTSNLVPLKAPAFFSFRFLERDRRRDPDNVCSAGVKFLLDSLQEAGILPGDGWKWVSGISLSWEVAESPGVVVTMRSGEENAKETNRG